MTQAWNYKNFNMVYELEISGEFIYDGIQALNTMDSSSNSAELFSFLYHISVGIERLQKIILVLNEDVDSDNYEKFEKSLITHSHNGLHQRIKKYVSIAFNKRENKFLEILSTFYEKSRYGRFNFNGSIDHEKQLLEDYVRGYIIDAKHTVHDHQDIIVDLWVKEILGRVIGDISRKYYVVLHDIATRKNTFTYELRFCSKAEKIFLPNYRKESLIDMKIKEETIFKEFLLYLCNTKDEDLFLRYLILLWLWKMA